MPPDIPVLKSSRGSDNQMRQHLARRHEAQRLAAGGLIRRLLTSFLDQTPGATQISLSIRAPDAQQQKKQRTQYCVIKKASSGKTSAATHLTLVARDHEVALAPRQGRQCAPPPAGKHQPDRPRNRLSRGRATFVLACPSGDLTGAIIVLFDPCEQAPQGMKLRRLKRDGARLGSQIAAVLDLVGQLLVLPPHAEGAQAGVSSFRQWPLRA